MLPEEDYDPVSGQVMRKDHGFKRWMRGYKKQFFINTFDVLYFIGAAATAGLGIWAAVISMHESFSTTKITPFSCTNPA